MSVPLSPQPYQHCTVHSHSCGRKHPIYVYIIIYVVFSQKNIIFFLFKHCITHLFIIGFPSYSIHYPSPTTNTPSFPSPLPCLPVAAFYSPPHSFRHFGLHYCTIVNKEIPYISFISIQYPVLVQCNQFQLSLS